MRDEAGRGSEPVATGSGRGLRRPGETGQERGSRQPGGAGAILTAAALWGSTGTVAHFAPSGVSPVSIGAARIVIGGLAMVLIATANGAELGRLVRRRWPDRAVLIVGAVAVAGYQLSFFSAVRLTGVAIGTVLAIGSGPVFTGLISRLTGTARLSARWVAATATAIAGCSVLLTGGQSAGVRPAGACLALLAGLCYACYAVAAARLIGRGGSARPVMAIMFGGGGLLLLPVLLTGTLSWLLSARGLAVAGELGIATTAVAYLLYGFGLRTVQVPTAVTIGLAEPAVAALLAVTVLGERLTVSSATGLALVGVALAVLIGGRGGGPLSADRWFGRSRTVGKNLVRGSDVGSGTQVRGRLRVLPRAAQRRQVHADERARREQGDDHQQPPADHQARDQGDRAAGGGRAGDHRHAGAAPAEDAAR